MLTSMKIPAKEQFIEKEGAVQKGPMRMPGRRERMPLYDKKKSEKKNSSSDDPDHMTS